MILLTIPHDRKKDKNNCMFCFIQTEDSSDLWYKTKIKEEYGQKISLLCIPQTLKY